MAYMLTITMIQVVTAPEKPRIWMAVVMFVYQMIAGGLAGFLLENCAPICCANQT